MAAQCGQLSEIQTADLLFGRNFASYGTPPTCVTSLHNPSDFIDPDFGGLSAFYSVNEEAVKLLEQTPKAGQHLVPLPSNLLWKWAQVLTGPSTSTSVIRGTAL